MIQKLPGVFFTKYFSQKNLLGLYNLYIVIYYFIRLDAKVYDKTYETAF